MSKIRDLPEITTLADDDLFYTVDQSTNPNGGRKITKSNLKDNVKLTDSEIKTAYENNADTNAFTDAEKSKLASIESGATADQIAAEVPYNNASSGLSATNTQTAIDEVNNKTQADFRPSILSNRILSYTGGTARFDGVFYSILANAILLNSNITDGYVYVDTDGIIKQTGSSTLPPPYTIVFAKFSTDSNNITALEDQRVKNSQNIVKSLVGDITDVNAGDTAYAGNSGRIADAEHQHAVLTASATNLDVNSTSSEGTSTSLSRADHTHAISSGTPTTNLSPATTNSKGSAASFSVSDHTHAIATALVTDITTIQPDDNASAGTANTFSRGDHKHAIVAATAVSISSSSSNTEGSSTSFSRADHTHAMSLTSSEATATLAGTTTSLTDVLMVSMTLTPAAGTYLCIFSGSIVNSANGAERTWVSLYSGGTQVTATERSIGTSGGAYAAVSSQAVITVNGSQAIEVKWRVAGGTSTVRNRRLIAVKIG